MNRNTLDDLVIWQDADLLAVNKPPGLAALPDGYNPDAPHLISLLSPNYGRLWVVHRLDRETSGLILLARSAQAHQALSVQFERRQVLKIYHAIVCGNPSWENKIVRLPLRSDGDRQHRTVVDRRYGKSAITEFTVRERFGRYALLEVMPQTGRTHQIRAHLAAICHPITVDRLYGDSEGVYLSRIRLDYNPPRSGEHPLLSRLGLHAWSVEFNHPQTGERCTLQAPYPDDFAIALKQLHKFTRLFLR